MELKAEVKLGKKTKNLVKRLTDREIAVIDHKDIDQLAATSLINTGTRVVINASPSITGRYPNLGPEELIANNVFLLDKVGVEIFHKLEDGDKIHIIDNEIFKDGIKIAEGRVLDKATLEEKLKISRDNLEDELDKFVKNTLEYAKQEKDLILDLNPPEIETQIEGKHVLIVVRGQDYKEDLEAITSYIKEIEPILIGVDGGADALLDFGFEPHIIIGDMDSISDQALKIGSELIVHAYPNGDAPGLERIQELNLNAQKFPAPGTSEDIAMQLAYEKGAELITAVGTHSNMIDFLEKGRAGMSSTFLTRLKIGAKLVDAKGVNKLYNSRLRPKHIFQIIAAAMIPVIIILLIAPPMQQMMRLLLIKLRFSLGF
ncbi:putative cytokinetic ring protein SteA [Sporohalobacter salinus]|uniref:putative cytokinetic ring protein SteA n=1 Tax=Sporohalobacter salinus TaxID=1494606 RepID=UPI001960AF6D|nr:putative cytokinetic ring protein SteA [Sporohalobacter salinus]MBM7622775.1 putative membrane-anchored protein [Sporohalobacter salinus]